MGPAGHREPQPGPGLEPVGGRSSAPPDPAVPRDADEIFDRCVLRVIGGALGR